MSYSFFRRTSMFLIYGCVVYLQSHAYKLGLNISVNTSRSLKHLMVVSLTMPIHCFNYLQCVTPLFYGSIYNYPSLKNRNSVLLFRFLFFIYNGLILLILKTNINMYLKRIFFGNYDSSFHRTIASLL